MNLIVHFNSIQMKKINIVCLLFFCLFSLSGQENITSEFRNIATEIQAGDMKRKYKIDVRSNYIFQAQEYVKMQEAIAEKYPHEFSRPKFKVNFFFGNQHENYKNKTIGILGGMGPLSDANLLYLIMKKMESKDINEGTSIHLYSIPPPRTTEETALHGASYAASLNSFFNKDYFEYYMASNTAHANYKYLHKLYPNTQINHLPRIIADRIASTQNGAMKNGHILILGTTVAWNANLYASIFSENNMGHKRLNEQDQVKVQEWINAIKEGRVSNDSKRKELYGFIKKLGEDFGVKQLLLSCTELPLGLGKYLHDLEHIGFAVYDTEEMMAEIIVEKFTLPTINYRIIVKTMDGRKSRFDPDSYGTDNRIFMTLVGSKGQTAEFKLEGDHDQDDLDAFTFLSKDIGVINEIIIDVESANKLDKWGPESITILRDTDQDVAKNAKNISVFHIKEELDFDRIRFGLSKS